MTVLKQIQHTIKSLSVSYKNLSLWCKVLIFISIFLLLVLTFKGIKRHGDKEGFEQQDQFLFKTNADIYDDFYANIYDHLVFNNLKDDYEIGFIINQTTPSSQSRILDIGCGTGNMVASLGSKGLDVLGIDISKSMIEKAREKFPHYKFEVGDALNSDEFGSNTFTHIMCMYFTIYYFKDKNVFFENCFKWLQPGGFLIINLVDKHQFDPIIPPASPLLFFSPQRYAKERITTSKVKFDTFSYDSDFQMDNNSDTVKFVEKMKDDVTGKIRKNEHTLFMSEIDFIVQIALQEGFIVEIIQDLLHCQYEHQYLYIFVKPN